MSENYKPVGMTVADMQRANDAANADVVHTSEGAQRVVRNGQVVSHHDDQSEGATSAPAKRVHMARRSNRTWRKGEWA